MHVHTFLCDSTARGFVYLARRLLEQSEDSSSQLPLKTGVELEGWASLAGLKEVGALIADFLALI